MPIPPKPMSERSTKLGELVVGHSNRFSVVVDDGGMRDLGLWQKCDGLSVKFKKKDVPEGGNYFHVNYLLDRVEWDNITLTRAVNSSDTDKVFRWIQKKARDLTPCTAEITVFDHKLSPVYKWELEGVYPIQWKVPGLDAKTSGVLIEQLILVHQGFLGL
jgi:phage tail-like protein